MNAREGYFLQDTDSAHAKEGNVSEVQWARIEIDSS